MKRAGQNRKPSRYAPPDWSKECDICGNRPVLHETGMCRSCSTGQPDSPSPPKETDSYALKAK